MLYALFRELNKTYIHVTKPRKNIGHCKFCISVPCNKVYGKLNIIINGTIVQVHCITGPLVSCSFTFLTPPVYFRGNNVTDLKELKKLQVLPMLRALVLSGR